MNTRKKPNKRKYSPIPLLAFQIAVFNRCNAKTALAAARAQIADRLYAASVPERRKTI